MHANAIYAVAFNVGFSQHHSIQLGNLFWLRDSVHLSTLQLCIDVIVIGIVEHDHLPIRDWTFDEMSRIACSRC